MDSTDPVPDPSHCGSDPKHRLTLICVQYTDFFADAGAGEKAPALGCCCLA